MTDIESATYRLVREHPELEPTLRSMVSLARKGESRPGDGIGEFCREWVAAGETLTPRTLGA